MLNKPPTIALLLSCSLVFLPAFLHYPVFPAENQTIENLNVKAAADVEKIVQTPMATLRSVSQTASAYR